MSDVPQFVTPNKLSVFKALQKAEKATSSTLIKMTGKAPTSVKQMLKTLYLSNKIYICAYEISTRGKAVRVWACGDNDDAREPPMFKHKENFIPRLDEAAAWMRNPI